MSAMEWVLVGVLGWCTFGAVLGCCAEREIREALLKVIVAPVALTLVILADGAARVLRLTRR